MSKKTRRTRRMRNMLLVVSMMLVVAMASVGVTVAWLTDSTKEIVNTFTTSDISIELAETGANVSGEVMTNSYQMVPGKVITKDPEVTVKGGSEDCWLFVKLDKSANFVDFMTYTMADGWTELRDGVYYRTVSSSDDDQTFPVILNDEVTVKTEVTKAQLNDLTDANLPTLTVKAYACQKDNNIDTADKAWTVTQTGVLPDADEGGSEN